MRYFFIQIPMLYLHIFNSNPLKFKCLMEENRLKPMGKYDPAVFNEIYQKTQKLKEKLASQISHQRFGLTHEDMLSWFDVKIIYIFNKYHQKHNPDVLLGHVIRGLQFFKCRVLRSAYTHKYTQTIMPILEYEDYEEALVEEDAHNSNKDLYYELVIEFMQKNLSENAFELFMVQINPTPYILKKLNEEDLSHTKIPNRILVEYFDLSPTEEAFKYIGNLSQEIKETLVKAREHFNPKP